jgi:hypothetical protein
MLVKELVEALKDVNPEYPVRVIFDGKIDYNPSWNECDGDFYLEGVSDGDMKESYMVVCHRIDCGDEETFVLEGAENLSNIADARKMMTGDFEEMCDYYGVELNTDGKTVNCKKKVTDDEIWLDVSIYNADTSKDDWIRCHWKIVKI